MMSPRITLDGCGKAAKLRAVPAGRYALEYHDSTHLEADKWVRLAQIDIRNNLIDAADDDSEQYYTITKDISGAPNSGGPNGTGSQDRVIEDTLALALGRLGLVTPYVTPELRAELIELNEEDGIVIVPDTNSLHNGAVHWLLSVLRQPSVWLLPVVASLTTIQNRDAMIKGLVNKRKANSLSQALRSRGLVNGALGLLQRNRGRCQVVEIDPSLLRYQKMGSNNSSDPDQSDVLEDRLIIEAIHAVLRTMRSRTARRVVTSDVNIARVLEAEGIETLFVPTITLSDAPVDCVRFDALARTFVGAPLRALLWELTHAFSSIRLRRDAKTYVQLDCYWPGKTPGEWSSETLQCEFSDVLTAGTGVGPDSPDPSISTTGGPGDDEGAAKPKPADAAPPAVRPAASDARSPEAPIAEPLAKEVKRAANDGKVSKSPKAKASKPPKAPEISTVLPRASFPQMLKLLASARRLGHGTAEQIVGGVREETVTVDTARRALEILRRTNLLSQSGDVYRSTADTEMVNAAMQAGDLDLVSSVFTRFEPYKAFLDLLRERRSIKRDDVPTALKELLGPVGSYEAARLPRFHTLLGQAWTRDDLFVDGSQRPTDRDASDAFEQAFASTAAVGIASVRDLLPRFCELTGMSPWAAKKQIEKFVAERLLPLYSFQPAAGGKPITKDEIVAGSLDHFEVESVAIDRLTLGNRPVFTVEGPTR
jgi:hypothetical protein